MSPWVSSGDTPTLTVYENQMLGGKDLASYSKIPEFTRGVPPTPQKQSRSIPPVHRASQILQGSDLGEVPEL